MARPRKHRNLSKIIQSFSEKEPRITQNARITSAMSDGELIMSGMNSRFLEKEKVGELVATGSATFGDKFANLCEKVPEKFGFRGKILYLCIDPWK